MTIVSFSVFLENFLVSLLLCLMKPGSHYGCDWELVTLGPYTKGTSPRSRKEESNFFFQYLVQYNADIR